MALQLANLQTDARMSYGNDGLLPQQEELDEEQQSQQGEPLLPQEDTLGLGSLGFIHPESFNQPNTQNQGGARKHAESRRWRKYSRCVLLVYILYYSTGPQHDFNFANNGSHTFVGKDGMVLAESSERSKVFSSIGCICSIILIALLHCSTTKLQPVTVLTSEPLWDVDAS